MGGRETTSAGFDRREDLADYGYPEIPLFGREQLRRAAKPMGRHLHSGMLEICYMASGMQVFKVCGRDYLVKAGEFFVTGQDEPHGTGSHPREKSRLYWLQIIPQRTTGFIGMQADAAEILLNRLEKLPRKRHFTGVPVVRSLFDSIFANMSGSARDWSRVRIGIQLQELLALTVECAAKASLRQLNTGTNRVLKFIDENISEPLTVADMAAVAGVSESWFKARFRRELSIGPAEYVLRRRIDTACRLLSDPAIPITTIALDLGFSSSQNFATVFRRVMNTSPREFRKRRKA